MDDWEISSMISDVKAEIYSTKEDLQRQIWDLEKEVNELRQMIRGLSDQK